MPDVDMALSVSELSDLSDVGISSVILWNSLLSGAHDEVHQ